MQIVRTILWVVLVMALLVFSIFNWSPVEVKIWEGLVLETRIPALVIVSFLLGLVPMWLLHRGTKWRLNRRIGALEHAVRTSAQSADPAPVPAVSDTPAHEVPPPAAEQAAPDEKEQPSA
ncbi:MAG TPA: DUF1049 domain-containing protein [Alteraurantiacibacter sp.]|jgi:uncharacterized membrane protein YciS (DUF1049 family)